MSTTTASKAVILAALRAWINQRAGLNFADYGDGPAYRAEARQIAKDGADARQLLRAVELSGITADDLRAAFPRAFCGRLEWKEDGNGGGKLDYCTGQYWPTEYRKAACAVLARAMWAYHASDLPAEEEKPGMVLRANFARMFGRGLASRWFN